MSLDLEDLATIRTWRREALRASIAWGDVLSMPAGELPVMVSTDPKSEEKAWRSAVASLAHLLGGVTREDVDTQVRDSYRHPSPSWRASPLHHLSSESFY